VLNICEQESENLFGVIVQFGGQTPLNLAKGLEDAGVPIIGTQPRSIEIAEDRKLFSAMLDKLGIRQTPGGTALSEEDAVEVANRIGYPVLVRPSFVLGGRGMQLVHNEVDLRRYVRDAIEAATVGTSQNNLPELSAVGAAGPASTEAPPTGLPPGLHAPESIAATKGSIPPILVDHFLEDALEVDVDCISDGETW
jgi:carbamoyl-phosphate synthase large subunit